MKSRLALPLLLLTLGLGGALLWQSLQETGSRQRSLPRDSGAAELEPQADPGQQQLALNNPNSSSALADPLQSLRQPEFSALGYDEGTQAEADSSVTVTGIVVDHLGQPLQGAQVSGRIDRQNVFSFARRDPYGTSVLSAADGGYSLPEQRPGKFRLRVSAPGFAPYEQGDIALPREAQVSLGAARLALGVTLEGVVLDDMGVPVAGALVHSQYEAGGSLALQRRVQLCATDAQGAFLADRMAAGSWTLVVESANHLEGILEGESPDPGSRVTGLVLRLEPGLTISGKVSGLAPLEAQDYLVCARYSAAQDPWGKPQRTASIDSSGAFVLLGMRAEGEYGLGVFPRDRGSGMYRDAPESIPATARGGDRDVQLTYLSAASLRFKVLDASTKAPIDGMLVKAGFGWAAPLRDENNRLSNHFPRGEVHFTGLRQQAHATYCELQISSVGYRDYVRQDIELGSAEDLDLGVIELQPIPVVRISVVDRGSGVPIAGALVLMRPESTPRDTLLELGYVGEGSQVTLHGGNEVRGITGPDGVAVISSFEDQICSIRVSAAGYAPEVRRNLQLPRRRDHRESLELGPGASVRVLVKNTDGSPAGGLGISKTRLPDDEADLAWRSRGTTPEVTDGEGQAYFEHLQPGTYTFQFSDDAFERLGGEHANPSAPPEQRGNTLLVLPGGQHELVMQAPVSCALFGHVLEGGKPLVGARVRLSAADEGAAEREIFLIAEDDVCSTNSEGFYRLEGRREGKQTLIVEHASRSMDARFGVALVGGENRADLNLSISLVEGRVVTPEGEPIQGVRVRARRANEPHDDSFGGMLLIPGGGVRLLGDSLESDPEATSDADGRFRLRGVESGIELVLSAGGPGVQPLQTESFVLDLDELRETSDLVMQRAGSIKLELMLDGKAAPLCSLLATYLGEDAELAPVHQMAQEGRALLQGMRPGLWRVRADSLELGQGSGLGEAEFEIEVRPGEEFFKTLHLEPKSQ